MKGTVELPAVAIFTIVAGSLIIAFFVMVSQQQSSAGKASVETASLERFDALLKSSATARETENNITVIDETLLFVCDETGTRIEYESHIQKQMHNMLIFAPHRLEGGRLRVYSKGVDVPYRMGNILYVATDRFTIDNRTNLYDFPANFEFSSVRPKRTVVRHPATLVDRSYVSVKEEFGEEYGEVYYYGNPTPVAYPNHEMLYGAVLSEDAQTYNCVLTQYLKQMHFVNRVEWRRAQELYTDASSLCQPHYQFHAFQTIDTLTLQEGRNFDKLDAAALSQAQKEIAFMNEQLLRGDGCAIIY